MVDHPGCFPRARDLGEHQHPPCGTCFKSDTRRFGHATRSLWANAWAPLSTLSPATLDQTRAFALEHDLSITTSIGAGSAHCHDDFAAVCAAHLGPSKPEAHTVRTPAWQFYPNLPPKVKLEAKAAVFALSEINIDAPSAGALAVVGKVDREKAATKIQAAARGMLDCAMLGEAKGPHAGLSRTSPSTLNLQSDPHAAM